MFQEKENEKYKFAISVYYNDFCYKLVLGHAPMNLSKILFKFLQLHNLIQTCDVTGEWLNRSTSFDSAIPFTYTCTELKKVVAWIQKSISEEMKPTENAKSKCKTL